MIFTFNGHHGTSFESSKSIIESNYELSVGDEEWLGDGVYFFVLGVSSKLTELAEKWAIAQSWDNKLKRYKYKNYCVLKSEISVDEDNFLDLTTEEGIEVLDYFIKRFEQKLQTIGRNLNFIDGFLINLARNEDVLPIEVAKGNFYIKFAEERVNRINLRTSNCSICAVYNPRKNVLKTTVVQNGVIKGA
jgi:hypothetical protein